MMKKILIVSLALLVFGSFGCESLKDMKSFLRPKQKSPEAQGPKKFFWDSEHEPIAVAPIQTAPAPTGKPVFSESRLISVSETGSFVISRTYPWPECGIIRLEKTVPKEVELNKTFDYVMKVSNLTDTMLTDIVLIEELSDNFDYTSANPAAKEDLNKLLWEIESLGPKASKQITVSGVATHANSLENKTTVVIPIIPVSSNIRIVQPRLELTRTAPTEALLCDPIPVVFVVTNSGTGSAQNVRIIETLPTGLRTIDGKSKLILDVGTLGEGRSHQFLVELRASKTGKYISKAATSSTTGLSAESAETTTIVSVPVLTIKNDGPTRQYIGRQTTYEITITNRSDVPAKNAAIEHRIPEGVTSVEASEGAKPSGSKLVWELGTLAPNASKTVRVSYTPTEAGMLTHGATATAYCSEAVTASVKTLVTGISALLMELVDVDDPIRVGGRATYVISVTNQGSAAASKIHVVCILEDNVRYISSAGASAGSTEGSMVKFLPLSNLAPKAKAAWRVVVEAVKPGDVRFKVIMNAEQLTRPVEETEATNIYE